MILDSMIPIFDSSKPSFISFKFDIGQSLWTILMLQLSYARAVIWRRSKLDCWKKRPHAINDLNFTTILLTHLWIHTMNRLDRILDAEAQHKDGKVLDQEQIILVSSRQDIEKSLQDLNGLKTQLEEVAKVWYYTMICYWSKSSWILIIFLS